MERTPSLISLHRVHMSFCRITLSCSCSNHLFTAEHAIFKKHMSHVIRNPAFPIYENKDTDQLHSNCSADHHVCFRYIDSKILLLSKSEISSP